MLAYVTTNEGKLAEARTYLDGPIEQVAYDYTEIQAAELGPIAAQGAREAYRQTGQPVVVDDAGLFIEEFDGFPGPYSAFVEGSLGVETVWRLAREELDDRRASFRCVLGYCDGEPFDASPDPVDRDDRALAAATGASENQPDAETEPLPVKLFAGVVRGTLTAPRGDGGFGYDPIFEYDGDTLAELSETEKNAISHRGRALEAFAEWYAQR